MIPAGDPTSNSSPLGQPIPTFLFSGKLQTFDLQLALRESAVKLTIRVTVS